MSHLEKEKQKLVARIERIRGQVDAIERSLSTDADCADVLILFVRKKFTRQQLLAYTANVQTSLILRESTHPVIAGLLIGFVGAVGAAHLMRAILFGVNTLDVLSFVGVSTLFFLIAMLAAYLPARRAARVDPMIALRYE
jgi:hypothetical protein